MTRCMISRLMRFLGEPLPVRGFPFPAPVLLLMHQDRSLCPFLLSASFPPLGFKREASAV